MLRKTNYPNNRKLCRSLFIRKDLVRNGNRRLHYYSQHTCSELIIAVELRYGVSWITQSSKVHDKKTEYNIFSNTKAKWSLIFYEFNKETPLLLESTRVPQCQWPLWCSQQLSLSLVFMYAMYCTGKPVKVGRKIFTHGSKQWLKTKFENEMSVVDVVHEAILGPNIKCAHWL